MSIRARILDLESRRPRRPLVVLPEFETKAEEIAWEDEFIADAREKMSRAAPEDADLVEKIEHDIRIILAGRGSYADA